MNGITNLNTEAEALAANVADFIEKPNKAKSKRLRLELGELKKKITDYRRILIELDTAGY